MNRQFGLSAAALALAAAGAMPAHAALELQSAQDFGGSGLGAVNTVLTLQGKGNASFESGSVGRLAGSAVDLLQGDVKTGTSQTQTRSLESLGIQSAADLRVVFNAVEPGNQAAASVTLTDLRLNIYSPTGSLLFSSGAFSPVVLQDTARGAGNSGFVFALDAADVTQAQAMAFGAGGQANLVGLSASVSEASGGAETFYVANASLVPEPGTYAMLLAGLGVVLMHKRRRREA